MCIYWMHFKNVKNMNKIHKNSPKLVYSNEYGFRNTTGGRRESVLQSLYSLE